MVVVSLMGAVYKFIPVSEEVFLYYFFREFASVREPFSFEVVSVYDFTFLNSPMQMLLIHHDS